MKIASYFATIIILSGFISSPQAANSTEYKKFIENAIRIYRTDFDEAIKNVDKAELLEPDNFYGPFSKGVIYYEYGKTAMAGQEFKKSISLIKDAEIKIQFADRIAQMTTEFKSDKEYNLFGKAFKAIEARKPKDAIKPLLAALNLNKNNVIIYYELGYAYVEMKKLKLATMYFNKARVINPTAKNILNELKYIYAHQKDIKNLVSIVSEIIAIYGESPEIYQELAYAYQKNKNVDLAIQTLESSRKKFKNYSPHYFMLGELYFIEKSDCKKSRKYIAKFLTMQKKNPVKGPPSMKVKDYIADAKMYFKKCKGK